jgi:hypothetical protein
MATSNVKSGESYPLTLTFKDKGGNVVTAPNGATYTWQAVSVSGSLGTVTPNTTTPSIATFTAGAINATGYLTVAVTYGVKTLSGRTVNDLLVISGDPTTVEIVINLGPTNP